MDGASERYVITAPRDADVGEMTAALAVGESAGNILTTAELATDRELTGADTILIPELRISAAPLTEDQVAELQRKGWVVERDLIARTLPYDDWGSGEFDAGPATGLQPGCEEAFQAGYLQGLASRQGNGSGGFAPGGFAPGGYEPGGYAPGGFGPGVSAPFAPSPQTPFQALPQAPFALCPPGTRPVFGSGGLRCVPVPAVQPIPWNIGMVNAPAVWQRATGRGVKVAVLDTGIDQDHPDLTVEGGASFIGGASSWDDDNGHGTHCAGVIAARNNPVGVIGVAPGASLFAVKVLNGGGSGSLSQIVAGIAWAMQQGMDVISMSLGSTANSANEACPTAYQRAAEDFLATGGVIVAAAGNSRGTVRPWVGHPGRCSSYIAVAAVDRNGVVGSFSSFGPGNLVALAAPGVRVRSTYNDGGYRELDGTSMACPHVAGAVALLKEINHGADATQIRNRLTATARDLNPTGIDADTGAGLLDCRRAVFG